jgi:hypothetical protein
MRRAKRETVRIDGNIIPLTDNVNVLGGEDKRYANVRTVNLGVTLINQTGDNLTDVGLELASNGDVTFHQEITVDGEANFSDKLRVNENIDLASNYINGTGNDSEGLSFDGSGNATFAQTITVTGESNFTDKIRANENIDLASNYINGDGADSKGLSFDGTGNATFAQIITGSSSIVATSFLRTDTYLMIKDPAGVVPTTSGYATIFVDSADGDLKVKFGDGHVATIAADS